MVLNNLDINENSFIHIFDEVKIKKYARDDSSTCNISIPPLKSWLKVRWGEEYINSWVEIVYYTFFDHRNYPKLFQALCRYSGDRGIGGSNALLLCWLALWNHGFYCLVYLVIGRWRKYNRCIWKLLSLKYYL